MRLPMEETKAQLKAQPLFALFLTIALGYLAGEIIAPAPMYLNK